MIHLKNIILFLLTGNIFLLVFSCNSYKIQTYESTNQPINNKINPNEFSDVNLSLYRDSLENEMDEVINQANKNLDVGSPEGLLGNFITDLSIDRVKRINSFPTQPDFCILNNGGFRTSINKGPVTRGNIFEVMPFDNYLVVLKINGEELMELLNYIKDKSLLQGSRKAGVPISGMRLKIKENKISRCFINNKEIDYNNSYYVLTTDYLANGGDKMTFFKNCKEKYDTGLLLRDAIINYITDIGYNNIKIDASLDGRVEINK